MSNTFKPELIIRCPFCRDGAVPQHVGHGVMVCECCGKCFRVVYATRGKTGRKLGEIVAKNVQWGSQK
jgi:hypothetical protein